MQFEIVDDANYPVRLTFEAPEERQGINEIDVVRAAFREHIFNLARKGNSGSISNFDRYVARKTAGTMTKLVVKLRSKNEITEVLDQFYEDTGDAITEIPGQSLIPAFENEYVATRCLLGEMALELADDIRRAQPERQFSDEEIDQEVDDFASRLNDTESFPEE